MRKYMFIVKICKSSLSFRHLTRHLTRHLKKCVQYATSIRFVCEICQLPFFVQCELYRVVEV